VLPKLPVDQRVSYSGNPALSGRRLVSFHTSLYGKRMAAQKDKVVIRLRSIRSRTLANVVWISSSVGIFGRPDSLSTVDAATIPDSRVGCMVMASSGLIGETGHPWPW
jgi:hypothetical protein